MKFCKKCNRTKSINSFNTDPNRNDGKYPWCKTCRTKFNKSSTQKSHRSDDNSRMCNWCHVGIGGAHPNVRYCSSPCKSKGSLARMYGLTIEEYQSVIESMEGKCPICQRRVKRWCIDHKHATGETFGPVCNSCNTKLLAWTFHDLEIAERLLEFLRNPPVRKMFGPKYVTQKKTRQVDMSSKYNDPTSYPHGEKRNGKRVFRKRKR